MAHDEYETEFTASREEAATVLRRLTDGVLAGTVELGEDGSVTVDVPEEFTVEIECEREDGETSLEVEMEWATPAVGAAVGDRQTDTDGETGTEGETTDESGSGEGETDVDGDPQTVVGAATESDEPRDTAADDSVPVRVGSGAESLARFELFRDRADEWRWRLRHRNGNIIATSGEGYTRKHNARKGLRSVQENAPGAAVRNEE